MPFPNQVNVQQAPAVAGDFASKNPRYTVDAQQGQIVAGPNGLVIGRFAWLDPTGTIANNGGQGAPSGFVSRLGQGTITAYLAEAGMTILPGMPVTLFSSGDFYVKNTGASATAFNQKAYANSNDGSISFGATGSPPTSGTCSAGTLQKIVSASTGGALPTTNTCTASISLQVMTVTAVGAGSVLGAGQIISGGSSSVGFIVTGTTILQQLTGTAGGIGTYQVSISQTIGSTAVTLSGGGLTLTGGNATGVFAPGMTISGTNIPIGTTILGYGTATAGGAGTYYVDRPATTAATASTITCTNQMYLTVDSSSTGAWALNDLLSGASLAPTNNEYISSNGNTNPNLTGLGGAGTYLTAGNQTALTSQTISVYTAVETKWLSVSVAGAGELAIMSSHALG